MLKIGVSPVLLVSTNTKSYHTLVAASATDPLWLNENGTALPVSQLVAMVTHPTSLACIPPCFLRAGNGGKKGSYKNNMEETRRRQREDGTKLFRHTKR